MNGHHLIYLGMISLLLASGWIIRQIGGPYCYPAARGRTAKATRRRIYGRRQFWTSGFV